ncbi:FMN-binding negative transcriptional regulator [Shimia sp. SDUM112013]|uniref:FMN-binding negative transcriptional regulator n=1 Tax=Shimia sp. SDUM112013 TaxID=3136160 RepID=UPI0032EE9C22
MHPNPAFRQESRANNLAFARDRGFGVLAVSTETAPLLSHIPFLLSEDGRYADLHLVRSNPISRLTSEFLAATLAVSGPHSYISPDWYNLEDQVPTWNYVAVHLVGTLSPLPDSALPDLVESLSDSFEERLAPKPVWKQSKMQPDVLGRMMRMIRPFRLTITDVQGTLKLGQNKPEAARLAAASKVAQHEIGSETASLAALMQSTTRKVSR